MFKIYGKYRGNDGELVTEEIDETETKEEARELRVEYMIAFGPSWEITIG